MMERLALDEEARHTVDFLIRNHLKMSRIAFRRDTEEPEVVKQFAALFSTEEHLKMLCLLTLADVGAVSPETLTPWKEELLWRLYVDAYNQMTLGYGDEIIDRKEARRRRAAGQPPRRHLRGGDGALPRRAAAALSRAVSRRRRSIGTCGCRATSGRTTCISFSRRRPRSWELTVVSLDKPFLFSNICGVLSYFGMDILRGHALTSLTGTGARRVSVHRSRRLLRAQLRRRASSSTGALRDVVAGQRDVTRDAERARSAACCSAARRGAPHAGHLLRQRALAALHRARARGR